MDFCCRRWAWALDPLGRSSPSSYGARGAASVWQSTPAKELGSFGCRRGQGHPCVFVNAGRAYGPCCTETGVSAGHGDELEWHQLLLAKKFWISYQQISLTVAGHFKDIVSLGLMLV